MVINLYGGVGTGKSIILGILRDKYSAEIYECDKIAHELYCKGNDGYRFIVDEFGSKVLDENGEIDRKKLGDILYNDRELMEKVNSAIHPMVYKKVDELCASYSIKNFDETCGEDNRDKMIVIEAAVLPENRLKYTDYVWCVISPYEARVQRLKEGRGYDEAKTKSIIANQPSDKEYADFSDFIIENNGTFEELEKKIDEAIKHCEWQQR